MADSFSSPYAAFAEAVRIAGGQAALERLSGVKQQTISLCMVQKRQCPAEHALKIEAATGVSRHDLRPDLYPREPVLHESRR